MAGSAARLSVLLFLLLTLARPVTAEISGCIRTIEGEPVAGATVQVFQREALLARLQRLGAGTRRQPLASAVSDEAGSFVIEHELLAGDEVVVEAPGFAPSFSSPLSGNEISIVLQPAPTVTGSVRTTAGEPVADAVVYWFDSQHGCFWSGRSDARGRYTIPDPRLWAAGVSVLRPGIGLYRWTAAGAEHPLKNLPWADISIGQQIWTEGTVLGPDGPVKGAQITVDGWPVTQSGDRGGYRVKSQEGAQIVAHLGAMAAVVVAGDRHPDLVLDKARIIQGRVVEQSTGAPLAAISIWFSMYVREKGSLRSYLTLTDSKGSYAISNLPAGRYHVTPFGHGLEAPSAEIVDLRREVSAKQEIEVRRTQMLLGVVTDEQGNPVPAATVMPVWDERFIATVVPPFGPWQQRWTDCTGHFAIARPDEGQQTRLMVLSRGFAPATSRPIQEIQDTDLIRITLFRKPMVRGLVSRPDGTPLAGVAVVLAGTGHRQLGNHLQSYLADAGPSCSPYRSAADGTFEIPAGDWTLDMIFFKPGFLPEVIEEIRAGESVEPLEVVLQPAVSLAGRVQRSDGTAVAGAMVWVREDEPTSSWTKSSNTGEFVLEQLSPGTHLLAVSDEVTGAATRRVVQAPGRPLTITLPARYRLTGRVLDAVSRQPVVDASVFAEPLGRTSSNSPWAETGEDGSFTLWCPEPGAYALQVSATGYLEGDQVDVELDGTIPAGEQTVILEPGLHVSGLVNDERGEPIADVMVELDTSTDPDLQWVSATTDEWGEFFLSGLTAGERTVSWTGSDLVPVSRTFQLNESLEGVEITLESGFTVSGRVESGSGEPLPGAIVKATLQDPVEQQRLVSCSDDGSFLLEGLAAGSWQVQAALIGYETAEIEGFDPARSPDLTLVLLSRPAGVIHGSVSGGAATTQAYISAELVDESGGANPAEVSSDGTYRIESFPSGSVKVTVFAYQEGYGSGYISRSKTVELPPNGTVQVDFDLEQGLFEVRGQVTTGGRPEPKVRLSFYSGSGMEERGTDAGGAYSVMLPADSYTVGVYPVNGEAEERRLEVDGPTTFDIELQGVAVAGQVIDQESGEPVAGAEVSIGIPDGPWSVVDESSLRTGSSGSFRFENLLPASHWLKVSHPDHVQWRQLLDLGAGDHQQVQVVLEKASGISVTVVDARTNEPLAGTVVARDATGALAFDGDPQRQGWVVRLPLLPGSYRVSASAHGYGTRTVTATAPAEELVIGLTPGGTLVVHSATTRRREARLLLPSGEEYVRCWCNQIAELRLDEAVASFDNITPGGYTLEVNEPDGSTSTYPVTIIEGQQTVLRIR